MTAQSFERVEILRNILAAVTRHSIVGGRSLLGDEPRAVMKSLFMEQPLAFLEARMPEVIVLVMEYAPDQVSDLLENCIAALEPVPAVAYETVIEHTEWIRQLRANLYEKHIRGARTGMVSESAIASLTSDFISRIADPLSDIIQHGGHQTKTGVARVRSSFFAYITLNRLDRVAMYSAVQRTYSNILSRFPHLKIPPGGPDLSDCKGKQLLHSTQWLNDFRSELFSRYVRGKPSSCSPVLVGNLTQDFIHRVAEPLFAALNTSDSEHIGRITLETRDAFTHYVEELLLGEIDPVAIFTAVQRTYSHIMLRASANS
jgi:hypothetical protein